MFMGKMQTHGHNKRAICTQRLTSLCDGTVSCRNEQAVPSDSIANSRRVP